MGTLANSLFQGLMGWIRTLSSEIWNTITSPEQATLLTWIGAHWKILAAVLCVLGVVIDGVVYLFRWQPYRVWRSKARRGDEEPDAAEAAVEAAPAYEVAQPQEAYSPVLAAGPARMPAPAENASDLTEEAEIPPVQRETEEDPYRAYRRPTARYVESAYEDEEMASDLPYGFGTEEAGERTEDITAKFEQAIRPRRRRRVSTLLSDQQEGEYVKPDQLIDQTEAYHQPVYPSSWRTEDSQ